MVGVKDKLVYKSNNLKEVYSWILFGWILRYLEYIHTIFFVLERPTICSNEDYLR